MAKKNIHKLKKNILGFEQEKFDQLFLEYFPMLFHYGLNFSKDEQLVEDCIQELFIYLFEKGTDLTKIKFAKAYLFTALRRRILEIEQARHKTKADLFPSNIQFSADDFNWGEENHSKKQFLTKQLNELPWRQKEAIYLKFFNNLSAKEIADIMGITSQVVSNMVYKALKKLKENASKSILISAVKILQILQF